MNLERRGDFFAPGGMYARLSPTSSSAFGKPPLGRLHPLNFTLMQVNIGSTFNLGK
ncbi:MAG: hypothetical protein ACHBN1_14810 [Heteroscytonema crispum UTEX LB 1556]